MKMLNTGKDLLSELYVHKQIKPYAMTMKHTVESGKLNSPSVNVDEISLKMVR